MRKDSLRKIEKLVKKENLIGVTFNPTLEECDYLYSRGVMSTKSVVTRTGIVGDCTYLEDTTDFVIE